MKKKWCDLMCEFADFPRSDSIDGSRSCRTFQALWCKKLDKHVTKNATCQAQETSADEPLEKS